MKREEHIAVIVGRLRHFYAAERKETFGEVFLRRIEDPITPRTDRGNFRPNGIILLLAALAILGAATFLFFSVVQL